MEMQKLIFFTCLLSIHLLSAQNIDTNEADDGYNSEAAANILNSEAATQNSFENLNENFAENEIKNNLNENTFVEGSNREKSITEDEKIKSDDESSQAVDSQSGEKTVDEGLPFLQYIQSSLMFFAEILLPSRVVDELKSTEVNLLLHAILNTIFIIVVFILSFKVFIGGTAIFDTNALNDELQRLQLESVKLEQKKTDLATQLKELHAKVKVEEKSGARKEKEEAEKKLSSVKKEHESIQSSLTFLEQEVKQKEGKLKAQHDKQERTSSKNKGLQSELSGLNSKIESMKLDIKTKGVELREIEGMEERLKGEVQTLQCNLSGLQDTQAKATTDVSDLMKRANELEIENAFLLDKDSTNQVALEAKERDIETLRGCVEVLSSVQENNNNDDDGDTSLRDFISSDIVSLRLSEEQRKVESLRKTLKHEEETAQNVTQEATKAREDVERKKDEETRARETMEAAAIKLKTLSEYFKEKEKDLNETLKGLEAKGQEAEAGMEGNEDKLTVYNRTSAQLKAQVEGLQREIQEVESNFRKEVASLEKKAHDDWLSCRQSEREVKDATAELSSLQTKISEAQARLEEWYLANAPPMPEPLLRPIFPPPILRGGPMRPPFSLPAPRSMFPPPPPPSFLPRHTPNREHLGAASPQRPMG